MTVDKIITSDLINKAQLARKMWPDNKNAAKRLDNKISGRAGQRLTDQDKGLIVKVFNEEFLDHTSF